MDCRNFVDTTILHSYDDVDLHRYNVLVSFFCVVIQDVQLKCMNFIRQKHFPKLFKTFLVPSSTMLEPLGLDHELEQQTMEIFVKHD